MTNDTIRVQYALAILLFSVFKIPLSYNELVAVEELFKTLCGLEKAFEAEKWVADLKKASGDEGTFDSMEVRGNA